MAETARPRNDERSGYQVDAFDEAWTAHFATDSPFPFVAQFALPKTDPQYWPQLAELIAIDLDRRHCATQHFREQSASRETLDLAQADFPTTSLVPKLPLADYRREFEIGDDSPILQQLVRAEYAARRRGGDRVTREEYYAAFPQLQAVLERDFNHADSEISAERRTYASREPPRIAGYTIERELARTQMSLVYLVTEVKLERKAVLKIAWEAAGSLADEERNRTESLRMAKLSNHHVVEVYATSEYQGRPYLVCKYMPGGSLAQFMRAESGQLLPPPQAAALLRDTALTVQALHREQMVHRDIKPQNILLDHAGVPYLADFGLSWDHAPGPPPTTTSAISGTAPFMPPEQTWPTAAAFAPAVDIYSLGATLYALLTGRPPFLADTAERTIELVRTQEPVSPRRENPALSRDLETICLKCLEKNPSRRYASAQALADDLDRYLQNKPVLARPISPLARAWRWSQRNPVVAGLSTLIAALLVGVAFVSASAARSSEAARRNEEALRYAGDVLAASHAVVTGPLSRAGALLDDWLPERRGGHELRDFAWRLTKSQSDTAQRTLRGHRGKVRALAYCPQTGLLASSGEDGVIRLWDPASGGCVQTLVGHAGGVFDLAFSPDGRRLASASDDSTVRIWETATGREERVLQGHVLPVYAVVFHPAGGLLASAGGDSIIRVWDVNRGTLDGVLQGQSGAIDRLQFDATGERLAASALAGETTLWNVPQRNTENTLPIAKRYVLQPDFQAAAALTPQGKLVFLDVPTGDATLGRLGDLEVIALDQDASGRFIAIVGDDFTIQLLDRQAGAALVTHRGHLGPAQRVLLDLAGRRLFSGGDDGTVRVWSLPDPAAAGPYLGHHEHNISAAQFSADGELLVTGDYLGSLAVWDAKTGSRQLVLGEHYLRRKHDAAPLRIGTGQPLPDGALLKHEIEYTPSGSSPNPIVNVKITAGHAGEITGLALTPDGATLVSAGGRDVIAWDMATGKVLWQEEHPALVAAVALSSDGKTIATGCWDDLVRLFDRATGAPRGELAGHTDDVMCLAFRPTGDELASGGRDQSLLLWDLATHQPRRIPKAHDNTIRAVTYSPDGKQLLSAGLDALLNVWDAETGRHETSLYGHTDGVTGLASSANGCWLASISDGGKDKFVRVWRRAENGRYSAACVAALPAVGASFVAMHPQTYDIVMGRRRPVVLTSVVPSTPVAPAPPPPPLKPSAPAGLKLLGYAWADQLAGWPLENTHTPAETERRFLVVVASLPLHRLQLSPEEYLRLLAAHQADSDEVSPTRSGSLLIYPQRFVLLGADRKPLPAELVGRPALQVESGFEFMGRGESLFESHTATPAAEERMLFTLAWELSPADDLAPLQVQCDNDPPAPLPPLELEHLRPGKPFDFGQLDFRAPEGDERLHSQLNRSPGPRWGGPRRDK